MRRIWIAVVLALLASAPAAALEFYAGVGGGQSQLEATSEDQSVDLSGDASAWKVYGGLRVLKFFGVEAGYVDFGTPEGSSGSVNFKGEATGWDAYAVGILPLWLFEVFGKVGAVNWDATTEVSGGGLNSSTSDTGTDLAYGVGAGIRLGKRFRIRAEWEKFEVQSVDNLWLASVGLDIRF